MSFDLTVEQVEDIKHALGFNTRGINPGWRNYYAIAKDCDGYNGIADIAKKGYMRCFRKDAGGMGMEYFCVTDKGKQLVGLE